MSTVSQGSFRSFSIVVAIPDEYRADYVAPDVAFMFDNPSRVDDATRALEEACKHLEENGCVIDLEDLVAHRSDLSFRRMEELSSMAVDMPSTQWQGNSAIVTALFLEYQLRLDRAYRFAEEYGAV